jgi:Ca2+-binding RTX toxin-like protein
MGLHSTLARPVASIALVLGLGVGSLAVMTTPASAQVFFCNGVQATIVGTAGPNVIFGGSGPDVIVALAGDDDIFALGGDDIVCAGDGDDYIEGGPGNDLIFGVAGNDTADGEGGADTIKVAVAATLSTATWVTMRCTETPKMTY